MTNIDVQQHKKAHQRAPMTIKRLGLSLSLKAMKFHLIVSAAVLVVALTGATKAGELSIYEHNGSIMRWFVVGDDVTVSYYVPKPSLRKAGISEGSVLIKGTYEGNRIVGTAYTYKKGCKPAAYPVIGYDKETVIVLSGPAPVRVKGGCAIERYSVQSPNSELVFKSSARHH